MSAAVGVAAVGSADLTAKEQANARAALKFLRVRCGTWGTLARALRFKHTTLSAVASGQKSVTATLVLRIAKFAKVGVDDVLAGRFPAPGTCPHCGQPMKEAAE